MFRSFAIAISFLFTFTLTSCESIQRDIYITNFDHFVIKIENKANTYTDKDWEDADNEFKKFSEIDYEKFKNNLTEEQNSKINDLNGRYNALRIKQGIKKFGKGLKNSLEELKSTLKNLSTDSLIK